VEIVFTFYVEILKDIEMKLDNVNLMNRRQIFWLDTHPDELLYSDIARIKDQMDYENDYALIEDYFGTKPYKAFYALPSNINFLLLGLPPGNVYTSDYIIDKHTLFPFYAPFLRGDIAKNLKEDMKSGNKISIPSYNAALLDTHVEPLTYFRYCPGCVKQDRSSYGEAYWHRVHQLINVVVCPDHKIFLKVSTVEMGVIGQNKIKSLEQELKTNSVAALVPKVIDKKNIMDQVYLSLANQAKWLLENGSQLPFYDDEEILRRCHILLTKKGYINLDGELQISQLLKDFNNYYSPPLQKKLQCELEGSAGNWLGKILYPNLVKHPTFFLLVINFLGSDIMTFFNDSQRHYPFEPSPWPCLNPCCPDYKKKTIFSYKKGFCRRTSVSFGSFKCLFCGFTYCRNVKSYEFVMGQADDIQIDKIKTFGKLWDSQVIKFWGDPNLNLGQIVQKLGFPEQELLKQSSRLGLPRYPKGEIIIKKFEDSSIKTIIVDNKHLSIAVCRKLWLKICTENERASLSSLKKAPVVYSLLKARDWDWLKKDLTRRLIGKINPEIYAKWEELDVLLAAKAKQLGKNRSREILIKQLYQLNEKEFGSKIKLSSILSNIRYLPLTEIALEELLLAPEEIIKSD